MPNPIPAIMLGRLAVDNKFKGQGLGKSLLKFVIAKAQRASLIHGVVGVITQPLSNRFLWRKGGQKGRRKRKRRARKGRAPVRSLLPPGMGRSSGREREEPFRTLCTGGIRGRDTADTKKTGLSGNRAFFCRRQGRSAPYLPRLSNRFLWRKEEKFGFFYF